MSRQYRAPLFHYSAFRRGGYAASAFLAAMIGIGSEAAAREDIPQAPQPDRTIRDARFMICDEVGLFAFVRDAEGSVTSPQFPDAELVYDDNLIAVSQSQRVNGLPVPQSLYLSKTESGDWRYTGMHGIEPKDFQCSDITADLQDSFLDIGLATSWGLSGIDRRVALFDALEDDLRTRLELSQLEAQDRSRELAALEEHVDVLSTELSLAKMAVCEMANHARTILARATRDGDTSEFITEVASVFGEDKCLTGIENATYVSTQYKQDAGAR